MVPGLDIGLGTLTGIGAFGGLGYLGVRETNETNEAIASARNQMEIAEALKAREFSASEAEKLRTWQNAQIARQLGFEERMSSTAVQRRMQDLNKAGINPILAGKFDASSPAGAAGSGSQPATAKAQSQGYTAQNKMQGAMTGLSTAMDLAKKAAEIKKTTVDTANVAQNMDIAGPAAEVAKDAENIYTTGKEAVQHAVPTIERFVTNSAKKFENSIKQVGKIASEYVDKGKKMLENPNLDSPFYHNRIETNYSHGR